MVIHVFLNRPTRISGGDRRRGLHLSILGLDGYQRGLQQGRQPAAAQHRVSSDSLSAVPASQLHHHSPGQRVSDVTHMHCISRVIAEFRFSWWSKHCILRFLLIQLC